MDINQSPLSRYKSNELGITGSAEARGMAEAAKYKDVSGSDPTSGTIIPELKEGQMVKGQVLDSRFHEVKIQLEPAGQVVTARLSENVMLSIGQDAQFVVAEDNPDQLVLKYLPDETATPVDTVVLKALSASGLPSSQRNKALVSELLSHSMPIDKQTLQYLVKMSVTNREASALTLVLMLKNQIPMTAENIRLFEAYQSGTHQLLSDIHRIAEETVSLLKNTAANPTAAAEQSFISGTDTDDRLLAIQQIHQEIANMLLDKTGSDTNASLQTQLQQILEPEELTLLYQSLEHDVRTALAQSSGLTPDILKPLSDGSLSLSDTIKLLSVLYVGNAAGSEAATSQNGELALPQTNSAVSEIISRLIHLAKTLDRAPAELFDQSLLSQRFSDSMLYPGNPDTLLYSGPSEDSYYPGQPYRLSDILNASDRSALLGLLPSFPEANSVKEQILQGTASLREALAFIQEHLSLADQGSTARLLASPQYARLLEEALLQRWTISPEKLAKKEPVQKLYRQLNEDMERLNTFLKSERNTEELQQIQEPAKSLQENLHFISDLNDMFTYLQLPVQFRNREVHTDLYVFTKKNAIKDKNESVSVLLHLTMENLGALNVYLQLKSNELQADFYTENTESGNLIKENLPLLTKALSDKGYTVWAKVKDGYKQPDFSQDFIEQNSTDHNVKRYTFDVRT